MKDCVLAIDLGTSGPKVAVVTLDAEVLGWQTRPTGLALFDGGGAEQDPLDWWQAIVAAARAVLDQTRAAERIAAVAVTSQWGGTVLVDQDGAPLRPAIIWMDCRGARHVPPVCDGRVRVAGYGARKLARWIRLTGGAPSLAGKEPIAHLSWLRHNEPELLERAAWILEPKDWLNVRLTGEFRATYDSIAVHWATDNRDIHNIRYDPTLLEWIGLARDKLPDLCGATEIIGTLTAAAAAELGLSSKIPVVG